MTVFQEIAILLILHGLAMLLIGGAIYGRIVRASRDIGAQLRKLNRALERPVRPSERARGRR